MRINRRELFKMASLLLPSVLFGKELENLLLGKELENLVERMRDMDWELGGDEETIAKYREMIDYAVGVNDLSPNAELHIIYDDPKSKVLNYGSYYDFRDNEWIVGEWTVFENDE